MTNTIATNMLVGIHVMVPNAMDEHVMRHMIDALVAMQSLSTLATHIIVGTLANANDQWTKDTKGRKFIWGHLGEEALLNINIMIPNQDFLACLYP